MKRIFEVTLLVSLEDTEDTGLCDGDVEHIIESRVGFLKESLSVVLSKGQTIVPYSELPPKRHDVKTEISYNIELKLGE